jgi:hypothetical protein
MHRSCKPENSGQYRAAAFHSSKENSMSCIFLLIGFIVVLALIVGVVKYGCGTFVEIIGEAVEAVGDCFSKHEHH